MKKILFAISLFLSSTVISSAQMMSEEINNKPPKEYAAYMTDFYTKGLALNSKQQHETYVTILAKRKTLDSVRANNAHMDGAALWAINNMLNKKYKEILTAKQYMAYDDMQRTSIMSFRLKNPDRTHTH